MNSMNLKLSDENSNKIKKNKEKLKVSQNFDPIHRNYIKYLNQTQTQKDLSKTDYTYVYSLSYNKYVDPSKEWEVPNMCRRAIRAQNSQENYENENNTTIERVTNNFRTTINNTSRIIVLLNSVPIIRMTHNCPSLWLKLFSLLLLLVPFIYVMIPYKSILLPENSLDSFTVDMLSDHKINEFMEFKNDLQNLKDSNSQIKSKMEDMNDLKNNEFYSNNKFKRKGQKSSHISSDIIIDEIKTLINEAIYEAYKTGQFDFALESSGGTIINSRCSETFDPNVIKMFGITIWTFSKSPRVLIQPSISPEECWPLKGSNGYLVIKLSEPIIPTAFSYEHIPKQMSRDGNIDSAPKEFQVRGLEDKSDTSGHLFGHYIYEDNDRPMQYFEVQYQNSRVFQFIELVILSNHGHNNYTCLYRLKVHGKRIGHSFIL